MQAPPPLKAPPVALAVNVTVPVGLDEVPGLVSVTMTVSVVDAPGVGPEGFAFTVVVVERLFIVTLAVPELARCPAFWP